MNGESFIPGSLSFIDFFLVKRRGHQAVRLFFVHFGDVPCGDLCAAVGTKQCPVVLGEVNRAVYDTVVVHFYKVTLADFLVVGDEGFAMGASDLQNVAAADFFGVGVFVDGHNGNPPGWWFLVLCRGRACVCPALGFFGSALPPRVFLAATADWFCPAGRAFFLSLNKKKQKINTGAAPLCTR